MNNKPARRSLQNKFIAKSAVKNVSEWKTEQSQGAAKSTEL